MHSPPSSLPSPQVQNVTNPLGPGQGPFPEDFEVNEELQSSNVFQAKVVVGPGLYYMGVIDILQRWDLSKQVERTAKKFNCLDGEGLSAAEPHAYASRFQGKVRQIIEHSFIRNIDTTPSMSQDSAQSHNTTSLLDNVTMHAVV